MERMEIMDGVALTVMENTRFKTSVLSVSLITPLKKETAAYCGLIPYVLKRGSTAHPGMESVTRALDELYGANLEPLVRKKGESQAVGFAASFVDSRYLPGKTDQLGDVAALLFELLLSPALEDGAFVRESVKSEGQNQIDRIHAETDDKREYARRRLFETMCANEPFAVHRLGAMEDLERMTARSLYKRYEELVGSAAVELFYSGPVPVREAADIIRKYCLLSPRTPAARKDLVPAETGSAREEIERMQVAQGKLCMGFRTGVTSADADYPAMMLFNAVFGGTVSSKLFMHVREKLSLCYYASSYIEPRKGLLWVESGVEFSNFEKAREEIFAQLEACRTGDISADELEAAKLTLINSLRSMADSLYRTEDFYVAQAMAGVFKSPEELIADLERVSADDVSAAAKKAKLDTVYRLLGSEV